MNEPYLFVYGTLRRGGIREMRQLLPESVYVSNATLQGFLYDLGAYPGLLLDENGASIRGEVYQVSEAALKGLDGVERFDCNNPEASYYLRKQAEVSFESGAKAICWVYECNLKKYGPKIPIPSGDWIEYAKTKTDWSAEEWPDEKTSD